MNFGTKFYTQDRKIQVFLLCGVIFVVFFLRNLPEKRTYLKKADFFHISGRSIDSLKIVKPLHLLDHDCTLTEWQKMVTLVTNRTKKHRGQLDFQGGLTNQSSSPKNLPHELSKTSSIGRHPVKPSGFSVGSCGF